MSGVPNKALPTQNVVTSVAYEYTIKNTNDLISLLYFFACIISRCEINSLWLPLYYACLYSDGK